MKKKLCLGFIALAAVLFLTSCADLNYEAYVTIVNIGNLPMTAWVDGDAAEHRRFPIADLVHPPGVRGRGGCNCTWRPSPRAAATTMTIIVILLRGDRDVQTWLTGWDLLQNRGPLKKQSSVIHGPAPR